MTEAFCENPGCTEFGLSVIVTVPMPATNEYCCCRSCDWLLRVAFEEEEEG